MRGLFKVLGLWLLLLAAQQGAVVHELSHLRSVQATELTSGAQSYGETTCPVCLSYAQAASPAFSHAFKIPLLAVAKSELIPGPRFSATDFEVPQPRSRGPPALS
jgi:hypothetical protein